MERLYKTLKIAFFVFLGIFIGGSLYIVYDYNAHPAYSYNGDNADFKKENEIKGQLFYLLSSLHILPVVHFQQNIINFLKSSDKSLLM